MTRKLRPEAGDDEVAIILTEISELLASLRHTGDTFLKACTSVFLTFIAVSTGIVAVMADSRRELQNTALFRAWCVAAALLISVAIAGLGYQAFFNGRATKKRVERLRDRIEVLNTHVAESAKVKLDLKLLTLQGSNHIYGIAGWVTCLFGAVWFFLVTWHLFLGLPSNWGGGK